MFGDFGPRCRVCEIRISWRRQEEGADTCRLCERAIEEARQHDLAEGITHRCPECYEPNGKHLEGQCRMWSDGFEGY